MAVMAVQRAVEDQAGQGQRGLGRLAEGVAEELGAQPGAQRAAPGVDEDHRAQGPGLWRNPALLVYTDVQLPTYFPSMNSWHQLSPHLCHRTL